VRAALKTIWNQGEIDAMSRRLSQSREQLTLRVLLLLNTSHASQGENFDLLRKRNDEITEAVSFNYSSLRSTIEDYYSSAKSADAKADRRHAEIIAAILTTRGGLSRTITGPSYSKNFSIDCSKTTTAYGQAFPENSRSETNRPDFKTNDFTNFTQRILNALHFRSIGDRRIAIPKSHEKTFQWIYQDPASSKNDWDSFSEWMKYGKGYVVISFPSSQSLTWMYFERFLDINDSGTLWQLICF
jgi:hypothetical protein